MKTLSLRYCGRTATQIDVARKPILHLIDLPLQKFITTLRDKFDDIKKDQEVSKKTNKKNQQWRTPV